MYGKLVEVYLRKFIVKKEEKIKLNFKYKDYLNYFIINFNFVIVLVSYEGIVNYDNFNLMMLFIMILFDGIRIDEDIFNFLLEKEKIGEVVIIFEESLFKEEVIKNNIEICRNFIEINFLNK